MSREQSGDWEFNRKARLDSDYLNEWLAFRDWAEAKQQGRDKRGFPNFRPKHYFERFESRYTASMINDIRKKSDPQAVLKMDGLVDGFLEYCTINQGNEDPSIILDFYSRVLKIVDGKDES